MDPSMHETTAAHVPQGIEHSTVSDARPVDYPAAIPPLAQARIRRAATGGNSEYLTPQTNPGSKVEVGDRRGLPRLWLNGIVPALAPSRTSSLG